MLQRAAKAKAWAAAKRPDPNCATGVASLKGAGAQACCPSYCGECSEAMPPCIMEEGAEWEPPSMTSAAEDCNEAVPEWMDKAEAGVKAGKGGDASWKALEKAGKIFSATQKHQAAQPADAKAPVSTTAKRCPPKLSKAAMLQRATKARAMIAAKKPDPNCATGVASLKGAGAQACCPSYCGECSDYETCKSVRGQNSEGACCASKVLTLECGGPEKTPANVC